MGEKKEKKSKKKDKTEKEEAPAAEEEEAPKEEPKRAQRGTSNVFALFKQAQIQEFKEAFQMMDQDRDGVISVEDLQNLEQNLGRQSDPKALKEMIEESPGQLNFTHFLTLFGEKMHGTDTEQALRDAFEMFEPKEGKLDETYVRELLCNTGDQFTKDEVKQVWKEAPIQGGKFDYDKFVTIIKRGKEEDLA